MVLPVSSRLRRSLNGAGPAPASGHQLSELVTFRRVCPAELVEPCVRSGDDLDPLFNPYLPHVPKDLKMTAGIRTAPRVLRTRTATSG